MNTIKELKEKSNKPLPEDLKKSLKKRVKDIEEQKVIKK